jgi:hypothetical protein
VDSIEWSGFPTMVYVKAGSKEVMKYSGPRDAAGILGWLESNHSKADEIKGKLVEVDENPDENVVDEDL